jgi:uncharacterized protein YjbJ (UPF0337 family)
MKTRTEWNGNWTEMKGKLKQKFALYTNDHLLLLEGKREEIIGRLQAKFGKTKEEIHKLICGL